MKTYYGQSLITLVTLFTTMKLTLIILTTILSLVNANDLTSYNIKNIVCEKIPHEYDEYYDSCEIWKRKMSNHNPKNMIQCKQSIDGDTGEILNGCKPAFGTGEDMIKVSYHFKKLYSCQKEDKTCSEPKYIITAKTKLYKVNHPLVSIFIMVLCILALMIGCCTECHGSDAFIGAAIGTMMFGSSSANVDTWSWNYED